jgi:hypothetical protein
MYRCVTDEVGGFPAGGDAMEVTDWLRGLGLEQYATAFRDNNIGGKVLRRLTSEELRELGVASLGHRRRLLDVIAALDENEVPRRTTAAEGFNTADLRRAETLIDRLT